MKIIQTLKQLIIGGALIAGMFSAFVAITPAASADCGGVPTAIIQCKQGGTGTTQDTGLWGVLLIAINILSAGVGVAAVGGIVYGAILYTSAGGSPEQVKKAIGIITNVVIGVVAFALMFSLLNFLIPGGLFKQP